MGYGSTSQDRYDYVLGRIAAQTSYINRNPGLSDKHGERALRLLGKWQDELLRLGPGLGYSSTSTAEMGRAAVAAGLAGFEGSSLDAVAPILAASQPGQVNVAALVGLAAAAWVLGGRR